MKFNPANEPNSDEDEDEDMFYEAANEQQDQDEYDGVDGGDDSDDLIDDDVIDEEA